MFPGVERRGCVFHWAYALLKIIKHLVCKLLIGKTNQIVGSAEGSLTCPFFLAKDTPLMFNIISADANTGSLQDLVSYVRTNWIESTTWLASTWCIFLQPICINNDLQGRHRCLNSQGSKDNLNVYLLITLSAQ